MHKMRVWNWYYWQELYIIPLQRYELIAYTFMVCVLSAVSNWTYYNGCITLCYYILDTLLNGRITVL